MCVRRMRARARAPLQHACITHLPPLQLSPCHPIPIPTHPPRHARHRPRLHGDGETVTVALPKEEASGLINNQLESLSFKVRGALRCAACALECAV